MLKITKRIVLYPTLLGMGLILLFFSLSFSQGIILSDNPLEGRRIFEAKGCIKCHSVNGIGGEIGPDLGEDPNIQGILEITTIMWNHSPQMNEEMKKKYYSRPTFTMPEIEKLYSFLYFLRYLKTEGNAERGKRVFKEKECITCHSMDNSQSATGPDLRRITYFISPLFLIQTIWNHGEKMAEVMEKKHIARPELTGNELQDIGSYLRSINRTPKEQMSFNPPGNPANGEKIFVEKKCALCHSLKDNSYSVGPDLRKSDYNQSVSHIGAVIWNHAPQMWQTMKDNDINIPELADKEVADLIAYIYFLKFFQVKGNSQTGKITFASKGCLTCHKVGGEGGDIGPATSEMPVIKSALEFSRVIWNHASNMELYMSKHNIPWPELTKTEMENIFAFLREISKVPKTK